MLLLVLMLTPPFTFFAFALFVPLIVVTVLKYQPPTHVFRMTARILGLVLHFDAAS